MLSELCDNFQRQVDELDIGDGDHAARLRRLTLKLAKDAAEHVGEYGLGEVAALVQRSHEVLVGLAAEGEDPDERRFRYQSRQAVLSLLMLCEAIRTFHTGSRAERRKAVNVGALRDVRRRRAARFGGTGRGRLMLHRPDRSAPRLRRRRRAPWPREAGALQLADLLAFGRRRNLQLRERYAS